MTSTTTGKRFIRNVALLGAAALVAIALSACGSSTDGSFADPNSTSNKQVRLVQQPWEDLMVENEIAAQVLDSLGYEVKINDLSVPLGAQALAQNQADAYLGNWWPSQKPTFAKYLDAGKAEQIGTILTGTKYAPAVPKYVADKYNIHSFADLDKHADLFDHKFLGIEPGTPGNQYILDAIKKNAYGLGDWQLIQSSTPGMIAEVTRDSAKKKPVVFLAWSPHWMNVKWDLVYLNDPENVWPGAGEVRTLARKGFKADSPNVVTFLSHMKVKPDIASGWISDVSQKKKSPKDVAAAWIGANMDTIGSWLDGVKSFDGKPAAPIVAKKLGS